MSLITRQLPQPVIVAAKSTVVTSQTGVIAIGTTSYKFPFQDGTAGAVLQTDGQGGLRWVAPATTAVPVFGVSTVSSTGYLISAQDSFIRYTGAGAGMMRLPLASANPGKQIIVENLSESPLTIIATSIDNIDGDRLPLTLDSQFSTVAVTSDGASNWVII